MEELSRAVGVNALAQDYFPRRGTFAHKAPGLQEESTSGHQRLERRSASRRVTRVRRIAPTLMKGRKRTCARSCASAESLAHQTRFSSSTARSNACSQ